LKQTKGGGAATTVHGRRCTGGPKQGETGSNEGKGVKGMGVGPLRSWGNLQTLLQLSRKNMKKGEKNNVV